MPKLITEDAAEGVDLLPYKFIFHKHKGLWGSLSRGGLIRPLAWLYCFKNLNLRDLLRYTEKVGIPFIYANISDESFQTEAAKISSTLRRFSGDGAGVFSTGTEIKSLQRTAGGENVFMKCQELFASAIPKLILGTDATGTADAKFSNGQTGLVMSQKYREDDCDCLAETIRNTIVKWLVGFKYGFDMPLPFFKFDYEAAKDVAAAVDQIEKLSNAGYVVDPAQVEEETGWKVTKVESSQVPGSQVKDTVTLSAENPQSRDPWQASDQVVAAALHDYLDGTGQQEWFGALHQSITYALSAESEDEVKSRFTKMMSELEEMPFNSSKFEAALAGVVYESFAKSMVDHSKTMVKQ